LKKEEYLEQAIEADLVVFGYWPRCVLKFSWLLLNLSGTRWITKIYGWLNIYLYVQF